jgi:hypothetical protein
MNHRPLVVVACLAAFACGLPSVDPAPDVGSTSQAVQAAPTAAAAAPADYDGACGRLSPPVHHCGFVDVGVKGANVWYVDLASNGFGTNNTPWDGVYAGYGDASAVPVPADYDGDFRADLSVKDAGGTWYIDYASNGLGRWDQTLAGYGNAGAIPVPADYDGDGKADLAVKDSTGFWGIDYASNGFGAWDVERWGYGDASSVPVPADYDGDGKADLSVKTSGGVWSIDYSKNGFGGSPIRGFVRLWDASFSGYGDGSAIPVPADYDNDHRADLSVYGSDGTWYVDYASNGFGAWNAIYSGYGGSFATPVPGDYDHDGLLDLSAKNNLSGEWFIDFAKNGFGAWDSPPSPIDTVDRRLVDTTRPYIASTTVYGANGPTTALAIGVKYTVDVAVQPGTATGSAGFTADVEVNSDLGVPALLHLQQPEGGTYAAITPQACSQPSDCGAAPTGSGDCNLATHQCNTHRRFGITCSDAGTFPLGFQLSSQPFSGQPDAFGFNPDAGLHVTCTSARSGIFGKVTKRIQDPVTKVYKAGAAIANATVTLSPSNVTVQTDANGNWSAPLAGGPMTVHVSGPYCPGPSCAYSDTVAVNVTVPAAGLELDTPLEEAFTALTSAGMTYTTYIDYSRGRTILHTVKVTSSGSSVSVAQSPVHATPGCTDEKGPNFLKCTDPSNAGGSCPTFETLVDAARSSGARALINAVWWDLCNGKSLGYMYSAAASGGQLPSEPFCDGGNPVPPATSVAACTGGTTFLAEGGAALVPQNTQPLFGVVGTGKNQRFSITQSDDNFLETSVSPPEWNRTSSGTPIWDVAPRDGVSDLSYALQMGNPPVLANGAVIAAGDYQWSIMPTYDYVFARTAIGVASTGVLYLVVADGEGIHGGNGATGNQLGHFFRDVLHATAALALDSGLSTEMVLWGASGPRHVNTITGEDGTIQMDPYTQTFEGLGREQAGIYGSVANYLMAK